MDEIILTVLSQDVILFKRLDQYLTSNLEGISRTVIKELFKNNAISSSNFKLELKKMPPAGTIISVAVPDKRPSKAQAEDIDLEILFEDKHLVIVNKPAGMVTHPAPGNYTGTLVNAILYHCPDIEGVGDERRPGIVHRLDKGTSGVMVIAKTDRCHQGLIELFSTHNIERRYHAIIFGTRIERAGTIKTLINRHRQNRLKMTSRTTEGKEAITHFKVISYFEKCSLVELKLETGRTHQIRVHLSEVKNAPILCDVLYGNPKAHINALGEELRKIVENYPFPFLHAKILGFTHPITQEELYFEAEPPPVFLDAIKSVEGK